MLTAKFSIITVTTVACKPSTSQGGFDQKDNTPPGLFMTNTARSIKHSIVMFLNMSVKIFPFTRFEAIFLNSKDGNILCTSIAEKFPGTIPSPTIARPNADWGPRIWMHITVHCQVGIPTVFLQSGGFSKGGNNLMAPRNPHLHMLPHHIDCGGRQLIQMLLPAYKWLSLIHI